MGLVFDVQRFALHDGPGIRTTVFVKGCPLSCVWCHNPESISPRPELSYREDRCKSCLSCVGACPTGAHAVDARGLHVLHRAACDGCGKCTSACPHDALSIVGREMTLGEILPILERDRAYFQRSAGGLTVSGGEPMMQPGFTLDLLRAAKEAGFHTCLDTSGHGRSIDFERSLPWVDLYLFDYKATGTDTHERLTGQSPERIQQNLELVISKGANVVLRCPLVPGVNDGDAHMDAIAGIVRRWPSIAIEIMPFHAMGKDKARRVGAAPLGRPVPPADEATVDRWVAALVKRGCVSVGRG
jgi:glycyl-radical enzyme activating protein